MFQGATDLFCNQCYILNTVPTIVNDAECVWYGAMGSHVVRASPAQEGGGVFSWLWFCRLCCVCGFCEALLLWHSYFDLQWLQSF
jgi:hypothetical protein